MGGAGGEELATDNKGGNAVDVHLLPVLRFRVTKLGLRVPGLLEV